MVWYKKWVLDIELKTAYNISVLGAYIPSTLIFISYIRIIISSENRKEVDYN